MLSAIVINFSNSQNHYLLYIALNKGGFKQTKNVKDLFDFSLPKLENTFTLISFDNLPDASFDAAFNFQVPLANLEPTIGNIF